MQILLLKSRKDKFDKSRADEMFLTSLIKSLSEVEKQII